jgi:hypothetical protein
MVTPRGKVINLSRDRAHPQIRVMKADLKDMIRDELYGADAKEVSELHMRDGRLCVNGSRSEQQSGTKGEWNENCVG